MRQRKFMTLLFVVVIVICGLFFSSAAMAVIVPPMSCNTFSNFNGDGSPNLSNIAFNPIISIDNDAGQWPIVIINKLADNDNVCNNTLDRNYPCTVFKYKVSNPYNTNYQRHLITIPTCLDNSMDIAKGLAYPACNLPTRSQSSGTPDNSSLACGMRNIMYDGKPSIVSIPVTGTDVRIGVISMTLVANNTSPNTNYYCYNTLSKSGILGPACGVIVPEQVPVTCDPSFTAPKTTNNCLKNVAGHVVKLDLVNKSIAAVYECPSYDINPGCLAPICEGEGCSTGSQCVKQITYEALAEIYDCNTCSGGTCGVNGCGRVGKTCDPVNGITDCEVITDSFGSVEEGTGYFVVSEKDAAGVDHPTICLVGLGNVICYSK